MRVPLRLAHICWLALIAAFATVIPGAARAQAPQLTGLSLSSTTINVGYSAPPITYLHVVAQVAEPVAGLSFGNFMLTPAAGSGVSLIFDMNSRVAGTEFNGTYAFDVPIYQFSQTGPYAISVGLTGKGFTSPNSRVVSGSQLAMIGAPTFVTLYGGVDATPPSLVSIQFGPNPVDSLSGQTTVTVMLRITDAEKGFDHGLITFTAPTCPGDDKEAKVAEIHLANGMYGNPNDDIYTVTVDIPQNEVDGPWSISLYLQDQAGNNTTITSAQIGNRGPNYLNVIGIPCNGVCTTGVSTITSNFNGTAIAAGNYIWFNSVFKATNLRQTGTTSIRVTDQTVTFSKGSTLFTLPVPDSMIVFDPAATTATTSFVGGMWVTRVPLNGSGNTFLSGLAFQVPAGGLPGGINPVKWTANFHTDAPGVKVNWQWAAAVYNSQFGALGYSGLGVKAADDNRFGPYTNSDHAGTPENAKKLGPLGGARGGAGSNYTGSYSGTGSVTPCVM